MKKTFKINGRKVTIYSRKTKKPLSKKKKAENSLYGKFVLILLFIGILIMFTANFVFAFHDIDLAYNYKDNPLDHYNLFNNESRSSDELYSDGWTQIFGIIYIYNIFCLLLMGFVILSLIRDYDRYKRKFKRRIR